MLFVSREVLGMTNIVKLDFATHNPVASMPTTRRNIDFVTAYSPRPTTTYNEDEGVFKTSIGVDVSKNPKQTLKEIRRLG